jgi:hypothetical protein
MEDDYIRLAVNKLTGPENWKQWKVKLEMSLLSKKLLPFLTNSAVLIGSDESINTLAVIVPTLSNDALEKLDETGWAPSTTTPAETMRLLQGIVLGTAGDNICTIVGALMRCQRSGFNTLADWLNKITTLKSQLFAAEPLALADRVYVAVILENLREAYGDWYSQWTHDISRDSKSVSSRALLEFLGNQAAVEKQGAYIAVGRGQQQQQQRQPLSSKEAVVNWCDCPPNKNGKRHPESECWKRYPEKAPAWLTSRAGTPAAGVAGSSLDVTELASFGLGLAQNVGINRDLTIVDGGCSQHTFNDKKWFATLQLGQKTMQGASSPLHIIGSGKVVLRQGTGGVVLHEANYAPSAVVNMISEGQLYQKGAVFDAATRTIRKGGVKILDLDWKFNIKRVPGAVPGTVEDHQALALAVRSLPKPTAVPYSLLHHRLMHASPTRIIQLCKESGFPINDKEAKNYKCNSCHLSKAVPVISRVPVPKLEGFLDMVHWDYIHHDLGFGGLRYSLHAVDSATGYHWLLCVPDRNAATLRKKIDGWHRDVMTLTGIKPKLYFMDNAREFLSESMAAHCQQHTIKLLTHAPNVSEQNGRIERANRSLEEMARTIRIEALLPKFLWPFLMQSAIHVLNLLPTKGNEGSESPATKMNRLLGVRKACSITYLRSIGCTAYVLKKGPAVPARTDKLDARAVKGQLVGFDGENGHIYFVYLPRGMSGNDRATVVRVRDVRFIEKLPGAAESLPQVILQDEPTIVIQEEETVIIKLPRAAAAGVPQDQQDIQLQNIGTHQGKAAKSIQNLPDIRLSIEAAQGRTPPPEDYTDGTRGLSPSLAPQDNSDDDEEFDEVAERGMTLLTNELDVKMTNETWALAATTFTRPDHDPYRATFQPDVGDQNPDMPQLTFASPDFAAAISIPNTYREATRTLELTEKWRPAMQTQLERLKKMGTWNLVARPRSHRILHGKWVFTESTLLDGSRNPKARWVACGNRFRDDGFENVDLYAAVARASSVRLFLTIVATLDLEWIQGDFTSAFLNARARREVYVEQPTGFKIDERVCCLEKALYGIPDAPRWWQETLYEEIHSFGWERMTQDPCLFRRKNDELYLIVYVDDFKLAGPSQATCASAVQQLASKFELKILHEKNKFLGVVFKRERPDRTITLTQQDYIQNALHSFGFDEFNSTKMPWPSGLSSTLPIEVKDTNEETLRDWQAKVGQLIWISIMTRPDISFTVSRLASGNNGPTATQKAIMKQLWRYLKGTLAKGIKLGGWNSRDGSLRLAAYSDASFADNVPSRASTGGYVILAGPGPILWKTKRQTIVTTSTTEAEFINLTPTGINLLWIISLAKELGFEQETSPIVYTDSQNAELIALNPMEVARTKHIDVKYKWIIEQVAKKAVKLQRVGTNDMTADGLTKGLNLVKHQRFCEMIGLRG